MIHDGMFEYDELDAQKREAHLEELIDKFREYMNDGQPIAYSDQAFAIWWNKTIMARNQVGLTEAEQEATRKTLKKRASQIKGIGKIDPNWQNDPNINNYLLNAGEYFLYTYLTEDQLKRVPAVFTIKKNYQNRVYNYCKAYFTAQYGSEEEMRSIIRAGIIKTFEAEPEAICRGIAESGKDPEQVNGWLVTTFGVAGTIKIIAIVATIVISIVAAICDCIYKSNVEKYAAISKSVQQSGNPEKGDYNYTDALGTGAQKKTSSWSTAAIAALGGILVLLNN